MSQGKRSFSKPGTTLDHQIERLKSRGLEIEDEAVARHWLKSVGYYRLGVYWLPFEKPPQGGQTRSKRFQLGTTLSDVTDLYVFDRKLRLLMTEAIERNEIALRAAWTYYMANSHGPHAYMRPELFSWRYGYAQALAEIERRAASSSEVFIKHYRKKYDPPYLPPLWMVTEGMTLGELSRWVERTRDDTIVTTIARNLGLGSREILKGVFGSLSYTRNICAHHGRLWNRRHVKGLPFIQRFKTDLIRDAANHSVVDNSTHNVVVVLGRMLKHQNADTIWRERVDALVATRPEWQQRAIGYPQT